MNYLDWTVMNQLLTELCGQRGKKLRRQRSCRIYLNGWILLFCSMVLQGCGSSDSSQTDKTSESIVVYTAIESEQLPELIAAFESIHPDIELQIIRDSTGIIMARLLAEAENPRADVIWGLAATSLLVARERNLLARYTPEGLENIRSNFRDHNDPPYWVGNAAWMTAFCINTIEAERHNLPIPKSFDDLVNPIYRGHVVMPHPASSGTGFLTISAILQSRGEKYGWTYLDDLHENMAFYTHSGSKPAKLASQGEAVIGISFGFRGLIELKKGSPIQVIFPQEGSGWDMEANALVNKAQIKPAAKKFLDWAISSTAMKNYANTYGLISIENYINPPEGFPADPMNQLIKNDFEWAATNREKILEQWIVRYDSKSESR